MPTILDWVRFGRRKSAAKTTDCPVCRGLGTLRVTAKEAAPWDVRASHDDDDPDRLIDAKCWSCQGTGRVPRVSGRYDNNRFG